MKYILEGANLTGLVKWLNENKTKLSNKPFTTSDVQQYIRVGHIPYYMGGNQIEVNINKYRVKIYNLLRNEVSY